MALIRVGAEGVRTTRRHGRQPIHVMRERSSVIAFRSLCGIDRATGEWIDRLPGTLIDEDELCRHCMRLGAVARIVGMPDLPQDLASIGDKGAT